MIESLSASSSLFSSLLFSSSSLLPLFCVFSLFLHPKKGISPFSSSSSSSLSFSARRESLSKMGFLLSRLLLVHVFSPPFSFSLGG